MCTLVVMKNVFSGYPLVVAANRDEQFSRPAAAPTFKEEPHRILSPTDLERHGTWIGVNEWPLLVGLTNRKGIPSVRGLRSRGELVADALKRKTPASALESVMERVPDAYNAFHMVITDGKEGCVIVGNGVGGVDVDGHDIAPRFSHGPLLDGLTIVTNLGMGPGSPRGNAILRAWDQLRARGLPPPRYSSFLPMLTWHEGEQPREGFHGRRYGSTCLHPTDDDPGYGTVSSSVIRLSQTYGASPMVWHYWHGTRQKARPSACAVKWSEMLTLPIRSE